MIDYSNSKIYIIKTNKRNLFYVGGTTLTLTNCLPGLRIRKYSKLKRICDSSYGIELLENYNCENKLELNK